uniref:Uncharacterized protein n=1 Tax=Romanomermis culicivorax TaxID=13658 RepID=A0A915HSX4_ROMCU
MGLGSFITHSTPRSAAQRLPPKPDGQIVDLKEKIKCLECSLLAQAQELADSKAKLIIFENQDSHGVTIARSNASCRNMTHVEI